MIQGATRKVTLSVKTDTSERGWGRGMPCAGKATRKRQERLLNQGRVQDLWG